MKGVARQFGVHRRMVRQAVESALPPLRGYRPRSKPVVGPVAAFIDSILAADATAPRKQRHTARRIHPPCENCRRTSKSAIIPRGRSWRREGAVTFSFARTIQPVPALQPRLCLTTPVDHALALHPAGKGRVSIARRLRCGWREQSVPVADLAYAARQLAGETDVYLTQNRFFGHRRLVSRLAELDALFVDLDYYKTEHADAHPQHVLGLALEALQDKQLPPPSFAVASGRGLALVWLHHAVPRAALPRWRACQQVLWHTLRHLGADRLASDAARVLRLVGTRNSRSSTLVEGLTAPGEIWDFDQLADEILPLQRAELVALRLVRARKRAAGQATPTPTRWFDSAGLWELRLAELQRLREHRWLGTLPDGQRDTWMLLAGVAISYLVPGPMVRREIVALADEVTGGHWRERETISRMNAVIGRAEQAARDGQGLRGSFCSRVR